MNFPAEHLAPVSRRQEIAVLDGRVVEREQGVHLFAAPDKTTAHDCFRRIGGKKAAGVGLIVGREGAQGSSTCCTRSPMGFRTTAISFGACTSENAIIEETTHECPT